MALTKNTNKRIETKAEVDSYLAKLHYALDHSQVQVHFIKKRRVDYEKNPKYTNRYTIADIFPDESVNLGY